MISLRKFFVLPVMLCLILFAGGCFDNSTNPEFDDPENGNGNGDDDPPTYSHTEAPGHAAPDFLSAENYKYLEVEIDYMEGFAPDEDALTNLKSFLDLRLNKESVTFLEPTEIPADEQATYSDSDIRNLEDEHRNYYTQPEDSVLKAYMIIVDGSYDNGSVLGIAYYNTSSAFFGGTYEQVSGPSLNQPSRSLTETVSFQHEFGHLFGLVNIPGSGTEMQTDHQDDENGNHCDDDSCLMYYAMENSGLFDRFLGEEIPSLGNNCIADIQANGGK